MPSNEAQTTGKTGRVGRNRTHINGFGDRRTAIVLLPCGKSCCLLDLFVKRALALRGAVLLHLHTVRLRPLVAGRRVIAALAFGASENGEFTWHTKILFEVG